MKRAQNYVALGMTFLLSGCLLFIANWAHAAGSERLSFTSNRGGIFDIYVMDIDDENLRNVTNHPDDHFGPWATISEPAYTWSPDGRFLAYVSKRDRDWKIYVMDTRTQEHWRLTHRHESEWSPAWSPDGKWITFVSHDNERNYQIYKTDSNGAHLVQLTDFGGNGPPAWSPDGSQIAFVSDSHKQGVKKDGLYVMNADGRRLRQVLDTNRGRFGPECTWSPDGKQIAFSLYIRHFQREHLCVIDTDGKNFRQLTQGGPIKPVKVEKQKPANGQPPPPPPFSPLPEVGSPAWSPDGKWIAYVYSDTILWQTADIYIIDADGNGRGTSLVTGTRQDLSPAWVPEGFLSVSPSAEKQTTLWGRLKQMEGTSK